MQDIETKGRKKKTDDLMTLFRWTYRIQPTVLHKPFKPDSERFKNWISLFDREDDPRLHVTPQQFRWKPIKFPEEGTKVNFIEGITTMGGAGSPAMKVSLDGFLTYMSRMAYLS